MINRYKYNNIVWVSMDMATEDELKKIAEEFSIHQKVLNEISRPSTKPMVEVFDNFIYVIMHFPTTSQIHQKIKNTIQEIDFLIGKDFIITLTYDTQNLLKDYPKFFEVNAILEKNKSFENAGCVFSYIMTKIYENIMEEMDIIHENLQNIEKMIFEGKEKEMVVSLSKTSRVILDFERTISLHREIIDSFILLSENFFEKNFLSYSRKILNNFFKVKATIKSNSEFLKELRETNNSLLDTKQNETMKIFSIMAFFAIPFSLTVTFLNIGTVYNSLFSNIFNFWVLLKIFTFSIFLTICVFIFFKYKKWI